MIAPLLLSTQMCTNYSHLLPIILFSVSILHHYHTLLSILMTTTQTLMTITQFPMFNIIALLSTILFNVSTKNICPFFAKYILSTIPNKLPIKNLIYVGDIVLVADTNKPRHYWEPGLVQELILGTDQLCRAAVVRTPHGFTTHSILKLYPLEVNTHNPALQEESQTMFSTFQAFSFWL